MADRKKDAVDRRLEFLFSAEPLADDGFSDRIVRRIRRQIWVRRLALPIALVIGVALSARPALELLDLGTQLLGAIRVDWLSAPAQSLPQLPLLIAGACVFVIVWLSFRMLEE